jgi:2-methylcitrate dehydratase PrpD
MAFLTEVYADFIRATRYETLTPQTVNQAKKCLLDLVGVSIAGYKQMEFPRWVVDYTAGLGGVAEATIFGQRGRKFPAINAAFANGACAHALDMDDGHRFSAGHPGVNVIPAAIAAAEMAKASPQALIAGIVAGYEVFIRIASAINPSSLNRGFHVTGIVGPFGAAAAAASILGLNREETIGALGLAGLQGAGLMEVMHDDEAAKVKSFHPAKAAQAGLLAAQLAQRGARGPLAVLEGGDGFLKGFADKINQDYLTKGLGTTFEINNTYVKFYPACRHTHVVIDAVKAMRRDGPIEAENIRSVRVETYPVAIKLCETVHPATPSAARFSLPFTVATAIIQGDVSEATFAPENVRNAQLQELAGRVELAVTGKWAQAYPVKRGAGVSITLKSGQIIKKEMDLAVGEPENPATWDDFARKFQTNVTLAISPERAKILEDTVLNLEAHSLVDLTGQLEL